jgi:hypothetical protein
MEQQLGAKALTPLGAATRDDLQATNGTDTRTEAMTALAHNLAGLIGLAHG